VDIIFNDLQWMVFNVCLALLAVFLGEIVLQTKNWRLRVLVEILWLLFLPNTIYLLSDVIHLPDDLAQTSGIYSLAVIFMYLVLFLVGFITFYLALRPIDRMLSKNKKIKAGLSLLIINILVGFGLVLGRFLRVNSWDILTNPGLVFHSIILVSQTETFLILSLLFGLTSTLIYLGSRRLLSFL
jgi:uncharacterized membrane protein